jgi:hypothetical protein
MRGIALTIENNRFEIFSNQRNRDSLPAAGNWDAERWRARREFASGG